MSSIKLTIVTRDKTSRARTGILSTPHGKIRTPAFVPVATKAAIKGLTQAQMEELDTDILMVNTYHCYLRPGPELIEKMGGLHGFMKWNKPIMTDSGGFQVFSLGNATEGGAALAKVTDEKVVFRSHIDHSEHEFTPEKSMKIQEQLGADIIFAFDECLAIDADHDTTKKSLARTHAWAKRSFEAHKRKDQALYGIVQGGRFKDLREESAKFISSLDFPGFGIGSLFGDPKDEFAEILAWTLPLLPEHKPKHLLGIGAVDDIFVGVENGIDTFDCVLPTRLARVGYIFSSECNKKTKWRYRITNTKNREDPSPLDKNCSCYVCKNFSKAYVHHLFRADELTAYTLASYHNLAFFAKLMGDIRSSIDTGKFQELRKQWLH